MSSEINILTNNDSHIVEIYQPTKNEREEVFIITPQGSYYRVIANSASAVTSKAFQIYYNHTSVLFRNRVRMLLPAAVSYLSGIASHPLFATRMGVNAAVQLIAFFAGYGNYLSAAAEKESDIETRLKKTEDELRLLNLKFTQLENQFSRV